MLRGNVGVHDAFPRLELGNECYESYLRCQDHEVPTLGIQTKTIRKT